MGHRDRNAEGRQQSLKPQKFFKGFQGLTTQTSYPGLWGIYFSLSLRFLSDVNLPTNVWAPCATFLTGGQQCHYLFLDYFPLEDASDREECIHTHTQSPCVWVP